MRELCHRCHGELPLPAADESSNDDRALLFCPRCAAPQILLPVEMRVDAYAVPAADVAGTTGALPPPRVDEAGLAPVARGSLRMAGRISASRVDWRVALPAAALVSLAGGLLAVAGLKWPGAQVLSMLWTMSAAVTAIGVYMRRRPRARMDGRVGVRIGVATGLLMVASISMGLAATGLIVRFGTHGMAGFDQQRQQDSKLAQDRGVAWLEQQNQDKAFQQRYIAMMNSPLMTSPEMRAATALTSLAFYAFFILILSAGGGAFAGMLRGAAAGRSRPRQRG